VELPQYDTHTSVKMAKQAAGMTAPIFLLPFNCG
jgi:hypothetical protein